MSPHLANEPQCWWHTHGHQCQSVRTGVFGVVHSSTGFHFADDALILKVHGCSVPMASRWMVSPSTSSNAIQRFCEPMSLRNRKLGRPLPVSRPPTSKSGCHLGQCLTGVILGIFIRRISSFSMSLMPLSGPRLVNVSSGCWSSDQTMPFGQCRHSCSRTFCHETD